MADDVNGAMATTTKLSPLSVEETVERFLSILQSKGLKVFANEPKRDPLDSTFVKPHWSFSVIPLPGLPSWNQLRWRHSTFH